MQEAHQSCHGITDAPPDQLQNPTDNHLISAPWQSKKSSSGHTGLGTILQPCRLHRQQFNPAGMLPAHAVLAQGPRRTAQDSLATARTRPRLRRELFAHCAADWKRRHRHWNKKPAANFPARVDVNSFDDPTLEVICPTRQANFGFSHFVSARISSQ